MKLLDYFSKVYIINLTERIDRREETVRMLKRIKVDVKSKSVVFFPAIRSDHPGGFRTVGAHGCFLSHLEILRQEKANGSERVLIMEDDLELVRHFGQMEEQAIDQLNSQRWDIAYFGHRLDLQQGKSFKFESYQKPILTTHFLGFNQKIVSQLVDFMEKLLKRPIGSPLGGPMDVDGAYSTYRQCHPGTVTLVANPSLGYQRSSRSDVARLKWYDRWTFFRSVLHRLRLIKRLLR